MVSFDKFNMDDTGPIYLQIIGYIKRGIVAGTVADGDEMPSRRVLSALLGVNPNTIQKAYAMLEEEGLIHSRSGAKSCIVTDEEKIQRIREELFEHFIKTMVSGIKEMGLSREEALRLMERYWE